MGVGLSKALGPNSQAEASVETEELAVALVEAAADASVEVSTKGGSARVKQESVAMAVTAVIAKAMADAVAVSTESKQTWHASPLHPTTVIDICPWCRLSLVCARIFCTEPCCFLSALLFIANALPIKGSHYYLWE